MTQWLVCGLVFANQAGVPVFAAPALLGVGALLRTGDANVIVAVGGAVGASLCADLGWYSVGRWRGPWALAALGRLSRRTNLFVDDARRFFLAHDRACRLAVRFLPELNPVAAAFAGMARLSLKRFVVGAVTSAALWGGVWIGIGYAMARAMSSADGSSNRLFAAVAALSVIASLGVVIGPPARAISALAWVLRACRGRRGVEWRCHQ